MKPSIVLLLNCVIAGAIVGCGGSGGGSDNGSSAVIETGVGPVNCVAGDADGFNCRNVNLAKQVGLSALGGRSASDIWGWTDSLDNSEYALIGLDTGTAFVDITDPSNPVVLGLLPTETVTSSWRDIKVYENHAFIVSEEAGDYGMQVFDLTRLRTVATDQTFSAEVVYTGIGSAHNIAINEDSGFAYIVGGDSPGYSNCLGGLHIVDIRNPLSPEFAGCHSSAGYSHDVQCVNYIGPDTDHTGKEICFGANQSFVAISDVTDKALTRMLSIGRYPEAVYTHQAWLDETHRYLFVNDELDERILGYNTSTLVFDVTDLDNPVYLYDFENTTSSIDHNHYVHGNRIYQANYTAGLRILEFSDLATNTLVEVGYFDTYPESEEADFYGAWSVYPFFESGTIVVSDIDRGLFVLTTELPD